MSVSARSYRTARAVTLVVLLLAAALLLLVGTAPAFADAYCESCHKAGGSGLDPAFHPVPPVQNPWDPGDGQCTICHELPEDVLPGYQTEPHGPYPASPGGDHDYIYNGGSGGESCAQLPLGPARQRLWRLHVSDDRHHQHRGLGLWCDGCHTSGMSANEDPTQTSGVPQIVAANHPDAAAAHADIVTPACAECHGSDVVALHPDTTCAECHAIQPHAGATCTTCHPTMTEPHGAGPFFDAAAYNPNFAGYLSWSWASANIAGTTGSPHGNYATTTNKCAVCHAVHRASADGNVLTAVTDAFAANRTKTCAFCHGATAFSTKSVAVASDGTISPHGSCSRCHVESPHGVGASVYPVLTEHLLNTRADAAIANDLGTGSNGIVTADFDSGSAKGLTLGTGYLCNQCHSSGGAGINTVYAVNEAGATPAQNATTINNTTGHRVTAVATSDWNVDGSKGAYLTGRIAYNDANSCQACHDAKRANGAAAFPHGYVDAAGAYAPKSQPGASLIWLTRAGDADDPRELVPTPGSTSGTADVSVLTGDGVCLEVPHLG